ncbi:hypothetical protein [Uliginosibacterium sp. H1]|uniref:hypothetical protein n=1 Tax=Uliginosibacterium sp. H1 TaxID=3114757 RepID=UPI002E17DACC|nr:hypothetical protein [Uliginosibacterium sp. H1]
MTDHLAPAFTEERVLPGSRTWQLRLRQPPAIGVLPHLLPPERRTPWQLRVSLMLECQAFIAAIDGAYAGETLVLQMLDDPVTRPALLQLRHELYEQWPLHGQIAADCPHCGLSASLGLAHYWLSLGLPAWQRLDAQQLLLPPCTATPMPTVAHTASGAGGSVPLARCLWVSYPRAAGEQPLRYGIFPGTHGEENAASLQDLLAGTREADTGELLPLDLLPTGPAWRSIVGMANWLGRRDAQGALDVAAMPLGCFFLCDLLYFAARHPAARRSPGLVVSCPSCGQDFLPVQ